MSEKKKESYEFLVSACLAGDKCRYDCQAKPHRPIIDLVNQGKALAVCPEEMGGLPTPRPPAERQADGRYTTPEGRDVTEYYRNGAQKAYELAREYGVKEAYLKGRSPMCGAGQIYDGSFSGKLTNGDGELTKKLKKAGITVHETEPAK